MHQYLQLLFLLLPISLFGYGSEEVSSFTENYGHIAVQQMIEYDIPASIILAQAFLESKYGQSKLAVESNNFFGIKAKSDWNGPYVVMKSAEYKHRRRFVKKSKFRKYDYPEESWRDHSEFLANGKRYKRLFEKGLFNYKGWARGLQKAGYATDPKYAKKLIDLIERHHFNDFDKVAFRIEHNLPIDLERAHSSNHDAIRIIQGVYQNIALNISERELLQEQAIQEKKVADSIQFKDTTEAEEMTDGKFYVYLSEDPKPLVRRVEKSVLYQMDIKKK